uniref:C-type lectin domain-containing protein n=1 Tax=Neolamprologus brichardi TaxID=32507 RepID=A0A3Q4HPA5_NEOBR
FSQTLRLKLIMKCSLILCQRYEYYFIKEPKTWDEAQRYCREGYKDLATVPNRKYMKTLYTDSTENQGNAWIGLYSISGKENRRWHWSLPGLPEELSETDSGTRKCAMTELNKEGKWKADDCDTRKSFFCYDEKLILINESKNWDEAVNYCRELHRDLVSITSLEQQKLVQQKAKNANTSHIWLGLRYSCALDLWFWVNDQNVCYENWLPEELFETDSGTRKCAMTELNKEGKWKADDCNTRKSFFCYGDEFSLLKQSGIFY